MLFRKKRKQPEPEELLAKLLAATILAKRDGKLGNPQETIAGISMVDCASIADQVGSLELTGRGFLLIHEALLALHNHEDTDICDACHDSLHELIETTTNTLKGMVKKAANK